MKFPWSRPQPVAAEPPRHACSHPGFVVRDSDRVGWCTCTSCGAQLDRLVAAIDRANRRGKRR